MTNAPRSRTSPAQGLRSSVKGTAILCMVFGPSLWFVPIACALASWAQKMTRSTYDLAVPVPHPAFTTILDFGLFSGWIVVPLGLVLFYGGIAPFRDLDRGRRTLVWVAWVTAVAMLALGGLWGALAIRDDLSEALVAVGVLGHVAQAALVVRAALFLKSESVTQACAQSDGDASSPS